MTNKKTLFYNFLYDWSFPISFFAIIGIMMATAITKNNIIFYIGFSTLIVFDLFTIFYCFFDLENFKFWFKSLFKYKLTDNERILYDSLQQKAKTGYDEWFEKTKGNDLCGPWIKDYAKEENDFLDKVHKYFYGDDWYVSMPISCAQVNYIMFEDIKDKVKYE